MFLLDVDRIAEQCKRYWFFSHNGFNIISFSDKNYLSEYQGTLSERAQQVIVKQGFSYTPGRVFILTNVSYFGYCYNPVSFYYCYNFNDHLEYILAEVNNTPWDERYVYVLQCEPDLSKFRFDTSKDFHISPFMPMNLQYKWYVNTPGSRLTVHIQLFDKTTPIFDATMLLNQSPITKSTMVKSIINYPLMSQKVLFSIYWQALKLWIGGFKFYSHSRKIDAS